MVRKFWALATWFPPLGKMRPLPATVKLKDAYSLEGKL